MMSKVTGFAVRHAKATLLAWAAVGLVALWFALHVRLDALPDLTNNQVQVLTRAPGLAPLDVEQRVTRPLETALGGVPGLVTHRSISRYGVSALTLVFDDDVPQWLARQQLSERMRAVALPAEVDAPELGPMTGGLGEIYQFSLTPRPGADVDGVAIVRMIEARLAPLLRAVPGVVEVNVWGGGERTFEVAVRPAELARRGLTLATVIAALERATGRRAGAAVPEGERQVLLTATANPESSEALSQVVVASAPAAEGPARVTRLGEVAEVRPGLRARIGAATSDGEGETVYVMVQMLLGANALEITKHVKQVMAASAALIPPEVVLRVVYDRSELVGQTLLTLRNNLLEGGALVLVVLLLMLGSLRAGLIVALAIPWAMTISLGIMTLVGIPGNLMSLGAIDFGLIVDGAVVMVEAIFHLIHVHRARVDRTPTTWRADVAQASSGVARPVFFSVLITLLVYVPTLGMQGVNGKLFRPMAITVVIALAIALAFALTFVPAAMRLWLGPTHVPQRLPWLMRQVDAAYGWLLPRLLPARWWVLAGALLLSSGAVLMASRLGNELSPTLDEGDLVIQTSRDAAISLDAAIAASTVLERAVRTVPEVAHVASRLGSPTVATDIMGLEQADIFVDLTPRAQWRRDKAAIVAAIEARINEVTRNAEPAFTQPIQMRFNELLGGASSDVVISIYGEDLATLQHVGEAYAARMQALPGVADLRILVPPDVTQAEVMPRDGAAASLGLTAGDLLDTVASLRLGVLATTAYEGRWPVPIMVRTAGDHDAWNLDQAPVVTPLGSVVPLASVAEVRRVPAPSAVLHDRGQRRLTMGFNVRGRDLASTVDAAKRAVAVEPLPNGYRVQWGGQFEILADANRRLALLAPLVVLLIVAVLWRMFGTWRQVLIVITHVPFALVGGVLALGVRGMPITMSANIGFIALAGIAVMNGVMMLSYAHDRERGGMAPAEAILRAAEVRARPVLMTAVVAALGFVPMMLATGVGAEVQRPLATVIIGGLVTSTMLTLIIMPAVYGMLGGRVAPTMGQP